MAMMLATINNVAPSEEGSARFEETLVEALLRKRARGDYEYYEYRLECDYGACQTLTDCAQQAGLVGSQFPWKTHMSLYATHLVVCHGYGASYWYHYPLVDDRWLVCLLNGDDVPKILRFMEGGGVIPGLELVNSDDVCLNGGPARYGPSVQVSDGQEGSGS